MAYRLPDHVALRRVSVTFATAVSRRSRRWVASAIANDAVTSATALTRVCSFMSPIVDSLQTGSPHGTPVRGSCRCPPLRVSDRHLLAPAEPFRLHGYRCHAEMDGAGTIGTSGRMCRRRSARTAGRGGQ